MTCLVVVYIYGGIIKKEGCNIVPNVTFEMKLYKVACLILLDSVRCHRSNLFNCGKLLAPAHMQTDIRACDPIITLITYTISYTTDTRGQGSEGGCYMTPLCPGEKR